MKFLFTLFSVLVSISAIGQNQLQINGEADTAQCGAVSLVKSPFFDTLTTDDFIIKSVSIVNGCIEFYVGYGGGCGTTNFELITDGKITESRIPQVTVYLKLTDNDSCKAFEYRFIKFDVSNYAGFSPKYGVGFTIKNNNQTVSYPVYNGF